VERSALNVERGTEQLLHARDYQVHSVLFTTSMYPLSSSALMLLVGHQEDHPACKKLSHEVLVWSSAWSEMQIVCIWSS